ncbi:MAG: hypothetical protein CSB44_02545 [Gammaproteobacteria bacterium]|nr:MAG: hypothetical protein CSB44_02545 [Gammaproteobacteria bacterium]
MPRGTANRLETLDTSQPIWDQFFIVAPLVLIGTREADGTDDLAPKHMVTPMGWQNYFGFVCTPRHRTYQNIRRDGVFAVTWPGPSQWLQTSLSASPRCEDDTRHELELLDRLRSPTVDCPVIAEGYLYLECELDRFVDGFGINSLIVGRIVAASVDRNYLRANERDDQDLLREAPILTYVSPGRFSITRDTMAFPMPKGLKK